MHDVNGLKVFCRLAAHKGNKGTKTVRPQVARVFTPRLTDPLCQKAVSLPFKVLYKLRCPAKKLSGDPKGRELYTTACRTEFRAALFILETKQYACATQVFECR